MMSEPTAMNPSPRRIDLPGASAPDSVAASPQQLAQLQYLGVAVTEPLSGYEADRLVNQANEDPALAERVETWEDAKHVLHPDLFRAPPRFAGLSVPAVPTGSNASFKAPAAPAEPSPYAPIPAPVVPGFVSASRAPTIRPTRSWPVKFVAVVAVLAALGAAGWFLRNTPWMQQGFQKLSSLGVPWLPGSHPATLGQPLVQGQPVQGQPVPGGLSAAEFNARVAESQQLAVARYPALGTTTSEINMRFVHRYKLMLSEHSARLQDPNWPLQLADDCAVASGLKPAGSTANSSKAASRTRSDSARGVQPASGSLHPVAAAPGS